MTLNDDVTISDDKAGERCFPSGGYSDSGAGTDVVVRDEVGTLIAAGSLDVGKYSTVPSYGVYACVFTFMVENVPADRDFYSVEVSSRGELTYSNAEMVENGWQVDAELGQPTDLVPRAR